MATKALVTGATSGIGRATALLLAERGYDVIATARDPQGELARKLIEDVGAGRLRVEQLDLADPDSVERLCEDIDALDVLVNNAGYGVWSPLEHAGRELADRQMQVNFVGLVDITTRLIPLLRASPEGRIVTLGSIGSRIAFPLFGLYNASKFAVEAYTLVLRAELRHLGIRVTCIEPGYVESDFYGRSLEVEPSLREQSRTHYHRLSDAMDTFFHGLAGSSSADVAAVIATSIENPSTPARVLVGDDAEQLARLRSEISDDDDFYATLLRELDLAEGHN